MPIHTTTATPKKILCIHDLSCFGRCSLTVITPVLSAMGHQAVPLPTLALSTHTGGLGKPEKCETAAFGLAALAHYQTLGLDFDCIYTGYLGGAAGITLAQQAFAQYPNAHKIVDPVMGDHGKPYSNITPSLIAQMRNLCAHADMILPNFTEAHLLLDTPYPTDAPTAQTAEALAQALLALAPNAIITGIPMPEHIACAGAGTDTFFLENKRLPRSFPGTGDLYGAVLIGALLQVQTMPIAAKIAAQFVLAAIQNTPDDADTRLGVWFEPLLSNTDLFKPMA